MNYAKDGISKKSKQIRELSLCGDFISKFNTDEKCVNIDEKKQFKLKCKYVCTEAHWLGRQHPISECVAFSSASISDPTLC